MSSGGRPHNRRRSDLSAGTGLSLPGASLSGLAPSPYAEVRESPLAKAGDRSGSPTERAASPHLVRCLAELIRTMIPGARDLDGAGLGLPPRAGQRQGRFVDDVPAGSTLRGRDCAGRAVAEARAIVPRAPWPEAAFGRGQTTPLSRRGHMLFARPVTPENSTRHRRREVRTDGPSVQLRAGSTCALSCPPTRLTEHASLATRLMRTISSARHKSLCRSGRQEISPDHDPASTPCRTARSPACR